MNDNMMLDRKIEVTTGSVGIGSIGSEPAMSFDGVIVKPNWQCEYCHSKLTNEMVICSQCGAPIYSAYFGGKNANR